MLTRLEDESLQWRKYTPTLELDTKVSSGGTVPVRVGSSPYGAVAVQADGRVLVGHGVASSVEILRYLPDGTEDAGFGAKGALVVALPAVGNTDVVKLVSHKDGRVVVWERSTALARFWP